MAEVRDYDFIVVGSGAGGGPLACNLALHPKGYRVALLEAGPDPADRPGTPTFYNYSVPGLHTRATEDPRLSWEFFVRHYPEEDKDRQSKDYDTKYDTDGKGIFYPRAAAVGGCTAHHAMITLYPHRSDWDRLAKDLGDPSWSADRMRPLFERIENCQYLPHGPGQAADPATGHGFEGWLPLSMADPTVAFKGPKLLQILLWAYLVAEIDANLPAGKDPLANLKAVLGNEARTHAAIQAAVGRLLQAGERAADRLPNSARQTLAMLKPGIEKLLKERHKPGQRLVDLLAKAGKDVSDPFGLAELFQLVLVWLDPNRRFAADDQRHGAYSTPASILHGVRTGVRERILAVRALYPDRLHLITGALVTKVHIDDRGQEKRAVGVHYRKRGGRLYGATPKGRPKEPEDDLPVTEEDLYVRRPRGEVILAGGAFNTPQLLMLSGIGPRDHLEDKKVEKVYCNLPGVGKNLQDRYEVGVVAQFPDKFTVLEGSTFHAPGDDCGHKDKAPPAGPPQPDAGLKEWFNHRGVYASNGVAMTIIRTSAQAEKLPDEKTVAPDLFLFGVPGNFRGYYRGYSCHTQADKDTGKENHRRFTWAILKGRTRNRGDEAGTVRLADADPTHRPVINFNFFDRGKKEVWTKDRDALIEAVRFVELLLANPQLGAEIVWPEAKDRRTDEALGEFILREAWGHHACGTCKIGRDDDKDAVLDTRFRARGVKNLRVVDASVFPEIPGFFIITSIYLISEKASQDILADQEKPRDDWPKAP